eukprot:Pgem_evm1s10914
MTKLILLCATVGLVQFPTLPTAVPVTMGHSEFVGIGHVALNGKPRPKVLSRPKTQHIEIPSMTPMHREYEKIFGKKYIPLDLFKSGENEIPINNQ